MPLKNAPNNKAELVANFEAWTRVHFQVRDASTVYIGRTKSDLELPGPGGQQAGIALTSALGIVSLPWIGTLYWIGSNPNSLINIETFPTGVEIGR